MAQFAIPDPLQLFWAVMSFGVVFALVMLVGRALILHAAVQRRLALGELHELASAALRERNTDSRWAALLGRIEKSGVPLTDSNASIASLLMGAGFRSTNAQRVFTLVRSVLTLGLPALYVGICYAVGASPTLFQLYLFGSLLGLAGLYGPMLYLRIRRGSRRREITNGFPDILDLLLVCVEGGLGLEAALNRVGAEVARSHPLLSELLGTLTLELRAGRERAEALRRFSDRAGVDSIRSFTTLLIQSEKLGTSIGQTLRTYSVEMRERRRLRAEEKAHRLPVLLSIPLVVFMLPTMIGVLMLPAAIRVVRQVVPAMMGM